jgi:hypothetical protein
MPARQPASPPTGSASAGESLAARKFTRTVTALVWAPAERTLEGVSTACRHAGSLAWRQAVICEALILLLKAAILGIIFWKCLPIVQNENDSQSRTEKCATKVLFVICH